MNATTSGASLDLCRHRRGRRRAERHPRTLHRRSRRTRSRVVPLRVGDRLLGLLVLAAYGVGLPDIPPRRTVGARPCSRSVGGCRTSGSRPSSSCVGDALLPTLRGVRVGPAPGPLVPAVRRRRRWRARSGRGARPRGGRGPAQRRRCAAPATSRPQPERPAHLVAVLDPRRGTDRRVDPADRSSTRSPSTGRPWSCSIATLRRTSRSSARPRAPRAWRPGPHLSLFYEEWLGKLPLSELERVSLLFDIGEVHDARYGRVKRLVDVALGLLGFVVFVLVHPVRASSATWSPTVGRSSTARSGSARTARRSRS